MKVYVVCRPTLVDKNIESFLDDEKQSWIRQRMSNECEELVELCGRVCYMSFGCRQSSKVNREFVRDLITKEHHSVLEHASWTFIVTGVTRSFSHQLVRHRIGFSYSQLSQQYEDHSSAEFVIPPQLAESETARAEWEEALKATKRAYSAIMERMKNQYERSLGEGNESVKCEALRAIRSIARSVLPNCVETKIAFSANARSLRHFLRIRGGIVGDLEMRIFCGKLLEIMKTEAPSMFFDFSVTTHSDGYPIVNYDRK